jgi:hypothetical protein
VNDALDAHAIPNHPTVTISGNGAKVNATATLIGKPSTTYVIDFYGVKTVDPSHHGEGQVWLGSRQITTNSSGNGTVTHSVGAGAQFTYVAATATRISTGETSEFGLTSTNLPIPVLVVDDVVGQAGTIVMLKATLTNRAMGGGLPGKTIKFWINGSLIGNAPTVAGTGEATLYYAVPSGMTGLNSIEATYEGNASFAANSDLGELLIP